MQSRTSPVWVLAVALGLLPVSGRAGPPEQDAPTKVDQAEQEDERDDGEVESSDATNPRESESFEEFVARDEPSPAEVDPAAVARDPDFWKGLIGTDVWIRLADGSVFTGRMLGVEGDAIIAARRSDGAVVAVTSSMVTQVDAHLPGRGAPTVETIEPMAERGTGLLAIGIGMMIVGAPLLITAPFNKADCDGRYQPSNTGNSSPTFCSSDWIGYLVPGLVMVGLGTPLIAFGAHKRRSARQTRLAAGLQFSRQGARVGITGSF